MKKLLTILLAGLLGAMPLAALAEESFDGTVVAGETASVLAPFGGTVKSLSLKEGQALNVGDTVATIATTKVLAQMDGTVCGIFASAGDTADAAVLYLAPVSRYTVTCSLTKAYDSVETKFVHLGEKVYLQCVKDGSHKATGTITAVNGASYTVQTDAGELYLQESVYIYRSADYDTTTRIGTGTVSRTPEVAVSGSGSILRIAVTDGEEVEKGQLLFETVDGSLDALVPVASGDVVSDAAGVVAQVQVQAGQTVKKGDVLLTLYKPETYQIAFSITEDMLSQIAVGDTALIYFNWNEDKSSPFTGTVQSISFVSDSSETTAATGASATGTSATSGEASYTGYITFTPDATVRLGMTVTVSVGD